MPKQRWVILACLCLLGAGLPTKAAPQDATGISPGTDQVDANQCNSLCRYYQALSNRLSTFFGQAARSKPMQLAPAATAADPATVRDRRSKPTTQAREESKSDPHPMETLRAPLPAPQPAVDAIADAPQPANADTPSKPRVADTITNAISRKPHAATPAGLKPTTPALAAKSAGASAVAGARTLVVGPRSRTRPAAADSAQTNRANFAARTGVAADKRSPAPPLATGPGGNSGKVAAAAPNDIDSMVVLLMTRGDINSVSDLANQDVAMEEWQSTSTDRVRTAIAAAGAAQVRLSVGQTNAIHRLKSGEVPAAVLSLMSPEAAKGFPQVAGFHLYRIPISPKASL